MEPITTGMFAGKTCECSLQSTIATGTYTVGGEDGMIPETIRGFKCTKCGVIWENEYQSGLQKRFTTLVSEDANLVDGSGLEP